MQTRFKLRKLSTALVALGVISQAASVQAAMLEEVVVTAQKREQGANDIGITMNAFSGDLLRDLGVVTAEDIAVITPGLTVNETAATGVPLYTIRGVGFQDYSTGASSTVGLYFDEVAIPYTVMSRGAIFDVARVEVLKGPQGDLYGRNTTAGQINFVSNKPTDEVEGGVTVGIGNYGSFDFEAFISGPLSDSVNARVAIRSEQSTEGWQKSLTRDDELGEKDISAIRALFDFELNENANLLLNIHYVDDGSDNKANTAYDGTLIGQGPFSSPYTALADYIIPGGANFGETPPWYSTGNNEAADWTNSYTSLTGEVFDLRPKRDNQLFGASARLEWDFGEVTLVSTTGFDKFERVESNDWDGGFYNDSSNINTSEINVFSQEIRISGGTDELSWIGGLYYSKDDVDEYYHYFMSDSVFGIGSIPFGVGLFAATPIRELDTKYTQDTESFAVFGHVEWQFAERWRLTAGLRYTDEERDWRGCTFVAEDGSLAGFLNAQFGATLQAGDCGTINDDSSTPNFVLFLAGTPNANDAFPVFEESISTSKTMGKLGIDFAISDDVLTYLTYSTGFKSGGFNGANSNTSQQLAPYKEEELTAIELGLKATLLDGRMQLNMAAFNYDYEDKQEQDLAVTFVGNISGLTNVPESEINGAEIDLQWQATDGLYLSVGVAYLDTEIKEWIATSPASSYNFATLQPDIVPFDASGLELAQAPELSYHVLASYSWGLANGMTMELAADVSFQDDTSGGSQITDATEDFTLIGARVALNGANDDWRLLLWSKNLADEDYYPAAYTGGNGPYVRSNGMPRTYGVSLNYNF
ncbi:MAG: TonB-dependent receptor [Pseudomonadales bacterium]